MIRVIARWWIRRALSRRFDGVHVRGLHHVRALAARGPLIFAANHVSWWDGVLMLHLSEALGLRARFLMDAGNLARMPYARTLGAIGLEPGLAARAGLREALRGLTSPGDAVWIFPQGRQRPASVRPLGLQPGVTWLARRGAPVVPVALTYGWREAPVPAAIVAFGPAVPAHDLETALVTELDRSEAWLDGAAEDLQSLVAPAAGSPQHGLGARVLAWWAR